MRKGVRITIIVLAVLLCAGAAGIRVLSGCNSRNLSERRAALSQRLDSLGEAMTLLRGMDSLYRIRMHQEPVMAPVDSLRPEKATRADSLLADADSLSLQLRESTVLSAQALERARFTPSICPLEAGTFNLSARFGTRTDPVEGENAFGSSIIQEILSYINNHYTQPIRIENLARSFGVSVSYLSHEFVRFTNRSVYDYVLYRRVMLARQQMMGTASLNDIAYQCGFNDYSNFLRSFGKVVGMSPSQYRKQLKQYRKKEIDTHMQL